MRLYCPTCRTMYEESKERYDSLNGQVPCRVCRTTLMLDEPAPSFDSGGDTEHMGQVFTVDDAGKTTVLEAPSLGGSDLYGKTTMIDLAMISPAGDVPSTLTPSASPSNYANAGAAPNTGTGPYQSAPPDANAPTVVSELAQVAPQAPSQPLYPPQPTPAPMGGPPPGAADGGNFHSEPTFIFEVPSVASAAPSPMPQQQPMQASPAPAPQRPAPVPQQPAPFAPSGATQPSQKAAPENRFKRKVVVGGAAVRNAEQKTQALDISAFREIHAQGQNGGGAGQPEPMEQDGMVPVSPPAGQQIIPHNPSGANPMLPAHLHNAPPQPVVITAPGGMEEPAKGSKLPLVLGVLVLLLVAAFFLMAFEVLPRPGFIPKLGGGGSGSVSSAADSDRNSAPAVEIDHLLTGLREYVEPPIVSAGQTPEGVAVSLAVMSSQTGSVYRWVSTPDAPTARQVDADYLEEIPEDVERVFVVFDRTTNAQTFVETLDALLSAGHAPVLTGGSHLGPDSHFGYPASAVPGAPVRVQIDSRSVVVSKLDWATPRVGCYRQSVPAELVSRAIDEAFAGASPPFEVQVELTTNLDLQAAYNLAQALYRPDLNLRFRTAQGFSTPSECAQ